MSRKIRRLRKITVFSLFTVVFIVFFSALYLATYSFPEWLHDVFLTSLDTDEYVVEADKIRLNFRPGVVMTDARVYRKRIAGPAVLEADEIIACVRLPNPFRGEPLVRSVTVNDGVIRPGMAMLDDGNEEHSDTVIPNMNFRLSLNRCNLQGLKLTKLDCRLSSEPFKLKIGDIKGSVSGAGKSGTVAGNISYYPGSKVTDGFVETRINPGVLRDYLADNGLDFTSDLAGRFAFKSESPLVKTNFRVKSGDDGDVKTSSRFWAERFSYRGEDILRGDGWVETSFSDTNREVAVSDLLVVRQDGIARCGLNFDLTDETVEFNLDSTIHPHALFGMLGILNYVKTSLVDYNGPVRMRGDGVVGYENIGKTLFHGSVDGSDLRFWKFVLEDYSFGVRMNGHEVILSSIDADTYSGNASGDVRFMISPKSDEKTRYSVKVAVKDADFQKIAIAMGNSAETDISGTLSGDISISGFAGDKSAESIDGEGSIRIKDGRVFALPLFGGFSSTMSKIIPGLDFVLRQTEAKTDFVIAQSKAHTDKVVIEGDVLSLSGNGDYRFDGNLDFEIQVKLMKGHTLVAKILRTLTYPISMLFEYRLKGNITEPIWYPVNFSKDLLEKIGLIKEKDDS